MIFQKTRLYQIQLKLLKLLKIVNYLIIHQMKEKKNFLFFSKLNQLQEITMKKVNLKFQVLWKIKLKLIWNLQLNYYIQKIKLQHVSFLNLSQAKLKLFVPWKIFFIKEDIGLSLLNMICYYIDQYTVIYAEQNKIDTIYYFGTFTKKNSLAVKTLYRASKHLNKHIKFRFNSNGGYFIKK